MTNDAAVATPAPDRSRSRTQNLVAAALVAALMAALGPVAIPAGAVPITLQVFPVVLAALLLPAEWAAASMGVYLLLGAVGVPVYAHGTAGVGVLFGPTGGYIWGFVFGAALGALVLKALRGRVPSLAADAIAAGATIVGVYLLGWAWLAFGPTHLGPVAALIGGVLGFVGADVAKAAVAIVVAKAVRRALGSE
jgi:biotin transport system substrate-specific component